MCIAVNPLSEKENGLGESYLTACIFMGLDQ
jgi:hypothetical protein